jgi:hypothetical protein
MSDAPQYEVWAAIDKETGLVIGMASTKHYTFSDAVREFAPREVRGMSHDEALDSMAAFARATKGGQQELAL